MASKPASRNWNDIQIALAATAMAVTLGLWNVFAEPDLARAKEKANEPAAPPPPTEAPVIADAPTILPQVKIMLGGVAPQTTVIVQAPSTRRQNRINGGGGGGGGGGAVTSTRPS